MRIKTKLTLGVGLLFLLIIILSVVGIKYVSELKSDTENILVANYNSLEYSRNMLETLDKGDNQAFEKFEKNLALQELNDTEIGEKEATNELRKQFELLKTTTTDSSIYTEIRKGIFQIMEMNMQAIQRKSELALDTADKAVLWIPVTGMLCFIIAFTLLINLPSNIANPIKELTDSIKEIANQNYKKRVHFESHNEFGELAKSFNTMAEKLEEYSESKLDKILKGKKRIEALVDNMHDPVIGIDENRVVLFVNEEALKITGLKRTEFVGKQIQDMAITNDLIRDIVKFTSDQEQNGTKHEPLKIFADGKESYFEKEVIDINIIPTGEYVSQFIGQVVLLRNITPFKELDLAKTNFMGTVSHEFKTPIASIQMGIQLLENQKIGSLNEEQKYLLNGVREDANRLLKITGELLNMTQVESGSIQIKMSTTEVQSVIDYAVNTNHSTAEQKNIRIETNIEPCITTVMADGEKTAWVLTNLLSNAIRYSYENSTVFIDVKKKENRIIFSVMDTGEGIEPKYQSKVFDRYFRVPGIQKEGTGLGLSISKEFIEAQGGKLSVVSEYGAGSTFSFSLSNEGKI